MNKCKCCVALADIDGLRQATKQGGVKGQCAAGSLSAPLVCRCPPLLAISTPYLDVASHLSTAPACGAVAKLHLLSSCVRLQAQAQIVHNDREDARQLRAQQELHMDTQVSGRTGLNGLMNRLIQ